MYFQMMLILKMLNKHRQMKNCFDIFLRSLSHSPRFNIIQHNIFKKFWCSNWRYATHRHISMSYLANIDGNYSWHIKCSFDKLRENVWFNLDELEQTDPFKFIKLVILSDNT